MSAHPGQIAPETLTTAGALVAACQGCARQWPLAGQARCTFAVDKVVRGSCSADPGSARIYRLLVVLLFAGLKKGRSSAIPYTSQRRSLVVGRDAVKPRVSKY